MAEVSQENEGLVALRSLLYQRLKESGVNVNVPSMPVQQQGEQYQGPYAPSTTQALTMEGVPGATSTAPAPIVSTPVTELPTGIAPIIARVAALQDVGKTVPNNQELLIQDAYVDYKGQPTTIFSTTGQRKTAKEYQDAMDVYNKSQGRTTPKGFTIIPDGLMSTLRQSFEAVNQPLQSVGRGIEKLPDMPNAPINPVIALANLAKRNASGITGLVNTPEKLLSAVGSVAAASATGGASLPAQIAAQAIGTGLGYQAGNSVFGSSKPISDTLLTAAIAGAAQGAFGVVNHFMGQSISQRSQQQVAEGLTKLLKEEYGSISASPDALKAVLDTPAGVSKFVQLGTAGLRGDLDTVTGNIVKDISQGLPTALPRNLKISPKETLDVKTDVSKMVKGIVKLGNDILDNTGNTETVSNLRELLDVKRNEFIDYLSNTVLKNVSTAPEQTIRIVKILSNLNKDLDRFADGATVLSALKRSGADEQFNVGKFQREIQGYYKGGSPFIERVGNIAGRGADLNIKGGLDAMFPSQGTERLLRFFGIKLPTVSNNYAGTITGTNRAATTTATAATTQAIKGFLDTRNDR
jgi:hypothetical protein